MKSQNTFSLIIFAVLTVILILVGLALGWLSRSEGGIAMATQTLRIDSLDTERQLIEVRADSLMALFQRLQQTNKDVFFVENGGKTIEVQCASGRETAFNRLFLNDESLSSFSKVKNNGLIIELDSYQFAIKKYEQEEIDYVRLPAEMVQSMLLSIEN